MFSLELWNPNEIFRNLMEDENFEPQAPVVSTWAPSTDVAENENEIRLSLDLPGFKKEDLKIDLPGNNTLTISGERKFEKSEGVKVHRKERFYGNFARSFSLPSSVDVAAVRARFEEGILEITLPKRETAKARKIEVQ
jgi:HSP20 family protein